ncbi:MAG: hypothetical protein F8N37_13755 [Telmatospirillum sp.]|nr:hypothetical protein [Telmatospirillum sp.]
MMRAATILWAALAAVAGTGLFMLKYEVQAQEQRLSGLRKDIMEAQEQIHVLKAEWSYLNEPARLREQAERHLGLHPLKPSQITTIAALPMRDPTVPDAVSGEATPPAVPVPQAPQVSRRAPQPGMPALQTPRQVPAVRPPVAPLPAPSRPARSMTAGVTVPAPGGAPAAGAPQKAPQPKGTALAQTKSAPPVRTAAVKPVPKPTVKPATPQKPAPAPVPAAGPQTYAKAPVQPQNNGNVMVIKSPALAEPEVASTRVRP